MKSQSTNDRREFAFPILLILTAIVCLAMIQLLGGDCSLPIATASAILVFYTRRPMFTTWELLEQLYFMRTMPPRC